MSRLARWLFALTCTWSMVMLPWAHAQDLPDFGSPADTVLTKSREKLLGQSVIMQLRRAGAIAEDPQLTEYIRLLGAQLGSRANNGDFNFQFFVIDDDAINAFAMPGGVIGVNAGLLLATENESELAGVLAHEISHVTQRHIARSIYDQQRSGILTMAATIAALLIASATEGSDTEAAMGAVTAVQAAAAQRQINFTRAHDHEADRIGIDVLARANFDPTGMSSFFEKLARSESTLANVVPEMLRTHPTGTGRMAEARARASQLPRVDHVDSTSYGLAKARIRVMYARRPEDALAYYQQSGNSSDPVDRYGLALSLHQARRNDEAERVFRALSEEYPDVIAFRIGRAEALLADGLDGQALQVYQDALRVSPRNTPLVVSYAEAMIEMERPDDAHAMLLDLLNNVRPTPSQIQLLARAADAEGDLINAYHYLSEYFASIGDLELAITQLQKALTLAGLNPVQYQRFNSRIGEFEEVLAENEDR